MPTYEISHPDGSVYHVESDNELTNQQAIDAVGSSSGTSSNASQQTDLFPGDKPFQPSAANFGQRAAVDFQNTPQAKLIAAKKVGLDPQGFDEKGRLLLKNQRTGEVHPMIPNVRGLNELVKDMSGRFADLMPAVLPTAGMLGGDVATGGNPVGGMAGAAAGEAGNQMIANQITGGQSGYQPGEMAMQAAGAGGGYALNAALKPIFSGTAKMVGNLLKKAPDAMPEIGKELLGVPEERVQHVIDEYKINGRDPREIITPENASGQRPIALANRVLFGADDAPPTLPAAVQAYKKNLAAGANKEGLDAFMADHTGLDQPTLDQMKVQPVSEILNPENMKSTAVNEFAQDVQSSIPLASKHMQNKYAALINPALREHADVNIDLGDHLQNLYSSLAERHVLQPDLDHAGEITGYHFDPGYTDKEGKTVLKQILGRFSNIPPNSDNIYPLESSRMNLGKLNKTLSQADGELEKAFGDKLGNGKKLSDTDSAPVAEFIKNARASMHSVDPRFQEANKMYAEFMNGKDFFQKGLLRGSQGEMNMISGFDTLMKEPNQGNVAQNATRNSLSQMMKTMDEHMPQGKKIMPRLQKLWASQKLAGAQDKIINGRDSFSIMLEHALGDSSHPQSQIIKAKLEGLDKSLPESAKFLRDAKDHLAAESFSKTASLFKTRWLGFLLPSLLGLPTHGALAHIGSLGAASWLAKPSNFGTKILPAVLRASESQGLHPAQQQMLANLMRRGLIMGGRSISSS